jgi:hypothetical protein
MVDTPRFDPPFHCRTEAETDRFPFGAENKNGSSGFSPSLQVIVKRFRNL